MNHYETINAASAQNATFSLEGAQIYGSNCHTNALPWCIKANSIPKQAV